MHAHRMTLEERRALVVKDIVDAEANFEPGTVAGQLFEFFKWVQENTDTFDRVMVEIMLEDNKTDPKILHFEDSDIKEMVNEYLAG